jgi:hypothetical protein
MLLSVACTPSLAPGRMSRHPAVEVISRIAPDASALDLTAGAISLAVMTVDLVAPAHRTPDVTRQVTRGGNAPEPDGMRVVQRYADP